MEIHPRLSHLSLELRLKDNGRTKSITRFAPSPSELLAPEDKTSQTQTWLWTHHCGQAGNVLDRVLHLLLGHLDQHAAVVVLGRKRLSAVPRHPRVHLDTNMSRTCVFLRYVFPSDPSLVNISVQIERRVHSEISVCYSPFSCHILEIINWVFHRLNYKQFRVQTFSFLLIYVY